MYNSKFNFVLRFVCFIMTAITLNIFSFAAGPSGEGVLGEPALGYSGPSDIKLPHALFVDAVAAREQAQEIARIEEEDRIREEVKKKRNYQKQQRRQQNQAKRNRIQQEKSSEQKDQFVERMKKYMK